MGELPGLTGSAEAVFVGASCLTGDCGAEGVGGEAAVKPRIACAVEPSLAVIVRVSTLGKSVFLLPPFPATVGLVVGPLSLPPAGVGDGGGCGMGATPPGGEGAAIWEFPPHSKNGDEP